MGAELLGSLVVLALIDSTSFGTLLIPLWLMLASGRTAWDRVVLFLLTVAGFYLVLGVLLMAGLLSVWDRVESAAASTPGRIVMLLVGVGLLVAGLTVEPLTKKGKERRAVRRAARRAVTGPGRLERWRQQATATPAPRSVIVTLAAGSAAIEAASMVPYLGAIGLMSAADLSVVSRGVLLIGYCLIMILPALALLALRVMLHERLTPLLSRVERWMSRNAGETTAWVLFFLGLWMVSNAATALGLFGDVKSGR